MKRVRGHRWDAVVFDLFGTLIPNFSVSEHNELLAKMADILRVPGAEFVQLWTGETWPLRATGVLANPEENIRYICQALGRAVDDERIRLAARERFHFSESHLVPYQDALEALKQLKGLGFKTGMISDCSSEVPTLWAGTPFAPLVDVPVFSFAVGMKKPDPRIYLLACERLDVPPDRCVYVGDGGSRELSGAASAGMYPVLIRASEDKADAHSYDKEITWDGPVISCLKEILPLVTET